MKAHDQKHLHRNALQKLSKELLSGYRDGSLAVDEKFCSELLAEIQAIHSDIERIDQTQPLLIKELEKSLYRYTRLYDRAPLGFLTINNLGIITQANLEACRLFGAPDDSLAGKPLSKYISPDDIPDFKAYSRKLAAGPDKQHCELKLVNHSGESFDARLTGTAIRLEDKEETTFLNIAVDISRSIRDTQKLQDNINSLSELNKLLQLSIEEIPARDLYSRVLDVVLSFPRLGKNCKGLMFVKEENGLTLKAHKNIPQRLLDQCSARIPEKCLCGKVAKKKQPEFVSPGNTTYRQCFQYLPDCARYSVPILAPGEHIHGVLTLFIGDKTAYSEVVEQVLIKSSQVIAGIINRKTVETKLQERTELLSSIYLAADSIGLVVTDLLDDDALISRFSPGAEKMFGYQEEEVLHKSISVLYRENKKNIIPQRVKQLRQGGKITATDMVMRKKDGTYFPVVVTINPFIEKNGKTTRALSVINDISPLKNVQRQLERSNTALEKRVVDRTRELQLAQQQVLHAEKLAAIGQLSASIAHEFNSPLQGVMTVLKGVSKRAILEEEDLELVESAVDECNRMAKLIRDLQNFNRPSTGKCSWINLHQVLDSLLLLYKGDFHSKKIGLVKKYADALPAISVVPDQIRQVIINLLNNAADACEHGGIITVATKVAENGIELKVSDTGHGISPENIQRIFDPFFTTKPAVKGTGLGLSVCYGIIKSHKGVILVDSSPDEGTQFTITLPIKRKM